jgi:hypothetical protein
VAILALFAVIASGCQSATERLTEAAAERALDAATGGDVDVDLREGRMSVEGGNGESSFSVGASTGVPDRIAAVAPIPAGFEPVTTFEQSEDGKRGVTVTGTASGSDGAALLDDLEAALTADGWEQVQRSNLNDELLSLGLQRGDDVFNVNVVVDGDEAMVTLMLIEAD